MRQSLESQKNRMKRFGSVRKCYASTTEFISFFISLTDFYLESVCVVISTSVKALFIGLHTVTKTKILYIKVSTLLNAHIFL